MDNNDYLDLFFSRYYEDQLNGLILDDVEYHIDTYGVLNYVANVIAIPYSSFLQYINDHPIKENFDSRHITQSSSFSACEREMVEALLSIENHGVTNVELGRLFPQYTTSDNDTAYCKYGENQAKTAVQLGLVFEYYKKWYLNCTGYIYKDLDEQEKKSLLARNLLRDPLYARMMLDLRAHDIDILAYMYCIKSNETKNRRYDSILRLINICIDECIKNGISIHNVINRKKELLEVIKQEKAAKKNPTIIPSKIIPYVFDEMRGLMVADGSSIQSN